MTPPDEHHLVVFWVALLAVLVVARTLGWLSTKVGQPAVVGELAAGLLLGPSFLGRVAPDVFGWLFPDDDVQTAMLFTVGWIGVVLLLVVTGDETDLGLIRRLGKPALIVSAASLAVPLVMGYGVGAALPEAFLGEDGDRVVFSLFFAAALSISSLPVIAKILGDMGFLRRNFGQLTLAAGMVNDVIGWVILGVVAGLAQAGAIDLPSIVLTIGGLVGYFAFAFTAGQRLLDAALIRVRLNGGSRGAETGVVFVAAIASGAVTQALGVEAVLGAFVAGVLVGRSRLRDHRTLGPIEVASTTFFAPVFFATAGLRVDLGLLADGEVFWWAVVVFLVASVSKFAGAVIGARASRLTGREGAALGVGLNARGALEIVIAAVGLSLGVLNQASYTAIVLMAVLTTMLAPPLLRIVLRGWAGTPDELARLEREQTLRDNVLVRSMPVLVPTRGGDNSIMASQIVALAWPAEIPTTLATVHAAGTPADLRVARAVLADHPLSSRTLPSDHPVEALVAEVNLGHGVVVVGSRALETGGQLSSFIDGLARRSPVPVVIVCRGRSVVGRQPPAYGRVLIPVTGSTSSRAAEELGLNIGSSIGTGAVLVHVVDRDVAATRDFDVDRGGVDLLERPPTDGVAAGTRLLDAAAARAVALGARPTTLLVEADSTASGILEAAKAEATDLVVLGARRREVDGRLFLGHTIERVLRGCDATVLLTIMPPGK